MNFSVNHLVLRACGCGLRMFGAWHMANYNMHKHTRSECNGEFWRWWMNDLCLATVCDACMAWFECGSAVYGIILYCISIIIWNFRAELCSYDWAGECRWRHAVRLQLIAVCNQPYFVIWVEPCMHILQISWNLITIEKNKSECIWINIFSWVEVIRMGICWINRGDIFDRIVREIHVSWSWMSINLFDPHGIASINRDESAVPVNQRTAVDFQPINRLMSGWLLTAPVNRMSFYPIKMANYQTVDS